MIGSICKDKTEATSIMIGSNCKTEATSLIFLYGHVQKHLSKKCRMLCCHQTAYAAAASFFFPTN